MFNFIKRYWPTALATLILLTALTGVYAKYVVDKTLDGTAKITVELGAIQLLEHEAVKNDNGQYELTDTVLPHDDKTGNTYNVVLPGLDIPKDPYVQITDKTSIPVYVFVEVVSALNGSAITYTVDSDHWLELTGLTGKNGGTVYAYTTNKTSAASVTANLGPIYILKGNQVIVGQALNKQNTANLGLSFYACMGQVDAGTDAATVYKALFKMSNTP